MHFFKLGVEPSSTSQQQYKLKGFCSYPTLGGIVNKKLVHQQNPSSICPNCKHHIDNIKKKACNKHTFSAQIRANQNKMPPKQQPPIKFLFKLQEHQNIMQTQLFENNKKLSDKPISNCLKTGKNCKWGSAKIKRKIQTPSK